MDSDQLGFLRGDPAGPAPTNIDMGDPDHTQTPGFLDSLESFGSGIIHGVESGIETAYHGGKTVVSDVVQGAEDAVSKTVGIATGAVSNVTFNIVLILGVVGIALVLVARSGAVKITR